jgi:hypothetical protein
VWRSLPLLLPMHTKLNTRLTTLTQPRTTDSISRRLKLLRIQRDKGLLRLSAAELEDNKRRIMSVVRLVEPPVMGRVEEQGDRHDSRVVKPDFTTACFPFTEVTAYLTRLRTLIDFCMLLRPTFGGI